MSDMPVLVDRISRLRVETGTIRFVDVCDDPEDLEALAGLWVEASNWKTSVNLLTKLVGDELAVRLDGGSVEVAGLVVFASLGTPRETCTDVEAFF